MVRADWSSSPRAEESPLRSLLPSQERAENLIRHSVQTVRALGHLPTASRRSLPDFVILGAQRGGTTSLYRRLAEHPNVKAPVGKELQFLTVHYGRGMRWYRAHFPTTKAGEQTFEASPYYLFHPSVPQRAAQFLPDARFVVLLRDPVARAYSHYRHSTSLGFETLDFEDAIDAEDDRLAEAERLGLDTHAGMRLHRRFSYVHRGMYLAQLQCWFDAVGRDRVKVIKSEDFFHQPQAVFAELLTFLGLPDYEPTYFDRSKTSGTDIYPMRPVTRTRLRQRCAEDSEQVRQLLGWESAWAERSEV